MLGNIGIPGLILILVIALIIFGPKKLPEMGRAVGQTLKEFKKSTKELTSDFEDEKKPKTTSNQAKVEKTEEETEVKEAEVTKVEETDGKKVE